MTQITPILFGGYPTHDPEITAPYAAFPAGFPPVFNTALFSCWVKFPLVGWPGSSLANFEGTDTNEYAFSIFLSPTQITAIAWDSLGVEIGQTTWNPVTPIEDVWANILVSIDAPNNIMQCYINDVAATVSGQSWFNANQMAYPGGVTPSFDGMGSGYTGGDSCLADFWMGSTSSFFDLDVTGNRRKWIDGSGFPVDIGANGEIPTGTSPPILARVPLSGIPNDWLTNFGTLGPFTLANVLRTLSFGACAPWPDLPPPSTVRLNMDNVTVSSLLTESPCTAAAFSPSPIFTPSIGLRWSDNRGRSFGNAVPQPLGTSKLVQPIWHRTGYARDRVFELFWSFSFKSALNGAFVEVKPLKS